MQRFQLSHGLLCYEPAQNFFGHANLTISLLFLNDMANISSESHKRLLFKADVVEVTENITLKSNTLVFIRNLFNLTDEDNFVIVDIETAAINQMYGNGNLKHGREDLQHSSFQKNTTVLDGEIPLRFHPPNPHWAGHIQISFLRTRQPAGRHVNVSYNEPVYKVMILIMPSEFDEEMFSFNTDYYSNITEDSPCTYVSQVN